MVLPSTISSRGQIVIPADIRKKYDFKKGDKIFFVEKDGRIELVRPEDLKMSDFQ